MRIVFVAVSMFLASCGDNAADQAKEIAAMSEDADRYSEIFAKGVSELSSKAGCSLDAMRESAGFWRVTGEPLYFIYCGSPPHRSNRWYIDPRSGELSQTKSAL